MLRRAAAGATLGGAALAVATGSFSRESRTAQCESTSMRRMASPMTQIQSNLSERSREVQAAVASAAHSHPAAVAAAAPSVQVSSAREQLRRALWVFGPEWRCFASASLDAAEAHGLTVADEERADGPGVVVSFTLPLAAQPSEVLACTLGVITKCAPLEPCRRLAFALGCLGEQSMQDAMRGATYSMESSVHTTVVRVESDAEVELRLDIHSGAAHLALRTPSLEAREAVRIATAFRTAMLPALTAMPHAEPDVPDVNPKAVAMLLEVDT